MSSTADTEPGKQVGALISAAVKELDRVAGVTPATRPAHLRQLGLVLAAAASEAGQADRDPTRLDRDADLWRLREPGYLRSICEHPVARAGNALVLLPVVLTWIALGAAELFYVQQYTATPAADRPPFFADWLAQPWFRGPVVLSAVIVVTVLLIMLGYRRPAAQQAAADDIDRIAHNLEADLLPLLTILRSRSVTPPVADAARTAAADLSQAAAQIRSATEKLSESLAVIDRLGVVAGRLAETVPGLREQTDRLADLDTRMTQTVAEISRQAQPMTEAVAVVSGAAAAVDGALTRSETVLREATARLDQAEAIGNRTAEQQTVLSRAEQPFTAAADTVAAAAGKLGETVTAVLDTATQLRETVKDVNWLAMVSDGLRHEPGHPEPTEVAG
ncbi:hypothetical protein [Actinokineospora sp. NBRC 105648]|uniref:hypothetical protein n=1 Tax=Actinokineospora sp. NBRC 105648 TaxID=3032206 RepID=UPI00249F9F2B|nr:hypothetical protein [Actinokineospora sp. NBRC 105648]GLZ40796.1 hypothetical protein Acsp05_44200 [Actinokineospora sp. NBRC 105648]